MSRQNSGCYADDADKVNTGAMESTCQDRIVGVMQIMPDESEVNTGAMEPAR